MLKDLLQGKWLGHPLHPALVHVPTALFPAAVVFDLCSFAGGNVFVRTSFFSIATALLAVLLAVPTGMADWSSVKPGKPARTLGRRHLLLNVLVTILFAINLWLRRDDLDARHVSAMQLFLSIIGSGILVVSGYLGGLMTFDHGVSVGRQSKQKWRAIAEAGHARLPEEKG
jgi:uncharacterized membrane protein